MKRLTKELKEEIYRRKKEGVKQQIYAEYIQLTQQI